MSQLFTKILKKTGVDFSFSSETACGDWTASSLPAAPRLTARNRVLMTVTKTLS